jgi:hypothetical protein
MAFMSGKALFTYNPELFKDDENAGEDEDYEESKVETKEENVEMQEESKKEESLAEVDKSLFKNETVEEDIDFD